MEEEQEIKTPKKFFTKLNTANKNKPKITVYDTFFCVKIDTKGEDYIGSWVSSIDKDDTYNKETTSIKISGDDKDNHIRIRLKGLSETLKWIVGDTEISLYKYITVNLFCNDPFVINLVNEWIPLWIQNDFDINEDEGRPNKDLLAEIGNISTKINISGQWISCKTQEMSGISSIVDESLQKMLNE